MAPTVADGQRGLPPAEPTVIPTVPNLLWDQIETKYWDQIRVLRSEEDSNLEKNFQSQMDKLQLQHVIRHEQRLQIMKKIHELQAKIEELKREDVDGETRSRELAQALEAKRLALANDRKNDDDEKREWFKANRSGGTACNTATTTNHVNNAESSPSILTTPSTVTTPSAGSPVQNPVQNITSPVEVAHKLQANEAKVMQVTDIKTVARVELVDAPVLVHRAPTAEMNDVPRGTQVEKGPEAENHLEPESVAEVSNGTVGHAEALAPNGTDSHGGTDTQKGTDAHNGMEVEHTADAPNAPDREEAHSTPKPQGDTDVLATTEAQDSTDVLATTAPRTPTDAPNGTADIRNGVENTDAMDVNDAMDVDDSMDVDDAVDVDAGVEVKGGHARADRQDTESSSELTSAHSTPVPSPPGFQLEPEEQSKPAATPAEEHFDAIEVYDGSGDLVGTVRHIKLDNHWVNHVKGLPIKRHVEIRAGRKFTAENLESIYEPSDAKGAKWLGCYIQATGEVQGQPCNTCTKPVGVFNQCVILGSDEFPRCGNCEWNRQGCHGASLLPKSSVGASGVESPAKAKAKPAQVSTGGFTPVNNSATGQKARTPAAEDDKEDLETKESRSGRRKSSATPSQTKPSGRKSLPSGSSQKAHPKVETPGAMTPMTAGSPEVEGNSGSDDLLKINKSAIEFEDDGVVYTKPKFMEGVPLAKIDASHPYWEQDWIPLEEHIAAGLEKWRAKLEHHTHQGSAVSSKFLANRQVNRGNAILKFLEDGELHPYQIVGKEWVNKQLSSYDTVFRMVQVLEELRKFHEHIDVTPAQWLRHRLYEVWKEEGAEFNLAKTVHDLYHDPKVTALRAKSGFGNIGRPSGYRMEKGESVKRPSRGTKRKETHSTPKATPQRRKLSVAEASAAPGPEPQVPVAASPSQPARPRSSHRKTRGISAEQQLQQHIQKEEAKAAHASPRESKRQRLHTNATTEAEDIEFDGYTSSDSFSNDHVMHVDWRVYQVKHAKISTNTAVTQYWHWVDRAEGGSEENMFEHQVLKDVLPNKVTWGVYKEPYDFHLRLAEVTEVTYANDEPKIIIGTKEIKGVTWRGDVLVAFKRERTKRRFLSFIKKKGIKLVKTNKEYINEKWDAMETDVLPHYDSD